MERQDDKAPLSGQKQERPSRFTPISENNRGKVREVTPEERVAWPNLLILGHPKPSKEKSMATSEDTNCGSPEVETQFGDKIDPEKLAEELSKMKAEFQQAIKEGKVRVEYDQPPIKPPTE
jgi:hypothetical protein